MAKVVAADMPGAVGMVMAKDAAAIGVGATMGIVMLAASPLRVKMHCPNVLAEMAKRGAAGIGATVKRDAAEVAAIRLAIEAVAHGRLCLVRRVPAYQHAAEELYSQTQRPVRLPAAPRRNLVPRPGPLHVHSSHKADRSLVRHHAHHHAAKALAGAEKTPIKLA